MSPIFAVILITSAVLQHQGVGCLKLRVGVPQYKLRGELAVLECHYELEGDSLYSVKWYKENEEFYRFVPKSNPPQQSYKVDGIKVDHSLSDSKQVALRGVNLKSSGVYRCEVSAEAPSFASAQSEGRMEVVFLPANGPYITVDGDRIHDGTQGERLHYQVGEELNLNCTSAKSSPAAVLHWYINDQQVTDPNYLRPYPNTVHQHGLKTAVLGLRMKVLPQYFVAGELKVQCVAVVSPVLWQGNRESVVQRVSPLFENREALIFVRGFGGQTRGSLWLVLLVLSLSLVT